MPWSEKQNHLFRAIAHGWRPPASSGIHIKRSDATRMAHEGIKRAGGGALPKACGGLAAFAGGGAVPDMTPLYEANPMFGGPSAFENRSLTDIEGAISPYSVRPTMARGGIPARPRRLAIGGAPQAQSGTVTAGGNSLQDQAAQFGPRASALARLNAQITQSRNPFMGSGVPPAMTRSLGARTGPTLAAYSQPYVRTLRPQWTSDMQRWSSGSGMPGLADYGPGFAAGGRVDGETDPDWAIKNEYDRYTGFAEGGKADEQGGDPGDLLLALALLARRRPLNSLARPFSRAFAKPMLGIEAASKHRLDEPVSDARFNFARANTESEHQRLPVWKGQGAWQGEHGMEYNPLYVQQFPRTMGRVLDDPDSMRYAAQMGENLEQAATPVSRFVPHLFNTAEDANAMQMHGVDRQRLKRIAELLGPDVVTAHRPGNRAMMFPLESEKRSLGDLSTILNAEFDFPKLRYGRSDPDVDRVLLTRDQPSWATKSYADFGARPRSEMYGKSEQSLLGRPGVKRGVSRWSDLEQAP